MVITLQDSAVVDEQVGVIAYSDSGFSNPLPVNCGGYLLARMPNGDVYSFTEVLTYGANCINRGTVNLLTSTDIGTLSYSWYSPAGVLSSTGMLRRQN